MALHLILGSSGSGKSDYLYQHILEKAKAELDQAGAQGFSGGRNYFYIVPEQFTLQTQRDLVARQENHGIMNIDVVSFQRLAYRVFDELGKKQQTVLEETGKSFILRKIAEEKKDELKILKGNMKKPGYISEMKSMISELGQYRIIPEDLSELVEDEDLTLPFRYRISDIQVMYRGFLDFLEGHFVTPEEILELVAEEVGNSALLKDSILVLDGFTGFTPIQYHLLRQLFSHVKDIYVALTLDRREENRLFQLPPKNHLFSMSLETVHRLGNLAGATGQEVEEPLWLIAGGSAGRFRGKALRFLEQNMFRTRPESYKEEVNDINILSLPSPRQELVFVCSEIQKLVREEGYRYRDFAVVCGNVEGYGNYVEEVFQTYDVPMFLDKKNRLNFHPLTEMIRNLLVAAEQDFSYESMFAWLRCGLSGISTEEIDLLENHILANRIRGFSAWKKTWVRLAGVEDPEDLAGINKSRSYLAELLKSVVPLLKSKTNTVREKTVALYELICKLDLQNVMDWKRQELEAQNQLSSAMEYGQIYKIVMDLLDKLIQLLGEEVLDLKEYRSILEAGLADASIGTIPSGYDRVIIGDIERTRLPNIKVLFLVGVNDGLIPKAMEEKGLLTAKERELFAEKNLELAPTAREKAFYQKFYLYFNLCKPSDKLYLTWFWRDGGGKEAKRSYLIGALCKMFPALRITHLEEVEELSRIVTVESSRQVLAEGLRKSKNGEVSEVLPALYTWFQEKEELKPQLESLLSAAFFHGEKAPVPAEVAKALYGVGLLSSVTRLERFSACAFAHFMAYGIGVRERQLGEFAAVDMGSIFHESLDAYSRKMEEAGYDWQSTPMEAKEGMLESAMEEAVSKASSVFFEDARTSYTLLRMKRILSRTIDTVGTQVVSSSFSPAGYELSFETVSNLEDIRLRGRIDRMDTKEGEDKIQVRVIDYKSGTTKFQLVSLYHGLQLQLVVYLNAAVELLQKEHLGKDIAPAGLFYYHIDDPVIDVKGREPEEIVKAKIREQLALEGMAVEDGQGLQEDVSKKSQKAGAEDLQLLSDFVREKIARIGKEIYQGEIQASPYKLKDRTACDYCPYHGICGFDEKMPGEGYRKLEDSKELMEKIRNGIE